MADGSYDGSVKLGLKLQMQADQVKKEFDKIGKMGKSSAKQIEQEMNSSYGSIRNEVKNTGKAIKSAFTLKGIREYFREKAKLAKDTETVVRDSMKQEADEINASNKKIMDAYEELQRRRKMLKADMKDMESGYGHEEFDENIKRIAELETLIEEYRKSLLGTTGAQKEFNKSTSSEAYTKLINRFRGLLTLVRELKNALVKSKNALISLTTKVWNLGAALRSPKEFINKILPRMPGLFKSAGKTVDTANFSFRKLFTTLIKYGIGIRSLYILFNKVRSAVSQGLKSLVLYDSELNTSISNLMTALNTLKGSFASAFAPIIKVVAPIITYFCNLLATAVNYVGMFIAALTGQKTFMKATGVQQDYAASLQDTADAANAANEATKDYLSGLDEIKKFDTGTGGAGGGGGAGGAGGGAGGIEWEEVEIPNSIKNLADTLKGYIEDQDWDGLGEFIAEKINGVFQKVYDIVNWDNVGPKITPVIEGITGTFNSLVDNIDWDLIGRTFGAGLNTFVNTANLLLEGIHWFDLGSAIATALNGFIDEVDWTNLGNLLGNKVQALWSTFNGFVHNLNWGAIGDAIGDAINGFFEKFDFSTVTDSVATFLNGLFTILKNAALTIQWGEIVTNIAGGINTFISTFNWKENGASLNLFLQNLANALVELADTVNWKGLGEGIANFLAEIQWAELLVKVASAFWTALSGLISGLWETTEGKALVLAIAGWFTVTNIMPIVNAIVTAFTGSSITKLLGGALAEALGGGAAQEISAATAAGATAGGFGGLFTSLAAGIGVVTAAYEGGKAAIEYHTTAQRENTQAAQNAAIAYENTHEEVQALLQKFKDGTATTSDYTRLVELQGQTLDENKAAANRVEKATKDLNEVQEQQNTLYDQGNSILGYTGEELGGIYKQQANVTKGTGELKEEHKLLVDNLDASQKTYDTTAQDLKDIETALAGAKDIASEIRTQNLLDIKAKVDLQKAGNLEKYKTAADWVTSLDGDTVVKEKIDLKKSGNLEKYNTAEGVVTNKWSGKAVKKSVDLQRGTTFAQNKTVYGWVTNKYLGKVVSKAVELGKQNWKTVKSYVDANSGGTVYKTVSLDVQTYNMEAKIQNATERALRKGLNAPIPQARGGILPFARGGIIKNIGSVISNIPAYAAGTTRPHGTLFQAGEAGPEVIGHINGRTEILNKSQIASAIYAAVSSGIAFVLNQFATQLFTNMNINTNAIIRSLERATIPGIATGSTLPNNPTFLAATSGLSNSGILEDKLRQIIREEGTNGVYRFIAQLNGKTLFDEVIREGKLRQMQTGRNPFEFA